MSDVRELFDEDFLRRMEGMFLAAKRLSGKAGGGRSLSRSLGDGLEFADHRAYADGDDLRFIDWPYYARMEKLLLRLFHRHSESDVAVLLDASASMAAEGGEPFRCARRLAAALTYLSMAAGRRVRLHALGPVDIPVHHTGRDKAHIMPALEFLADLDARGQIDLREQTLRRLDALREAGTVVLLSDLLDVGENIAPALAMLARENRQLIVLHTFAPQTADPPVDGALHLRDAETDEYRKVRLTPDLRESYRRRWRIHAERVASSAVTAGGLCIPASSDEAVDRLVLRCLQQAELLGNA